MADVVAGGCKFPGVYDYLASGRLGFPLYYYKFNSDLFIKTFLICHTNKFCAIIFDGKRIAQKR